MRESRDESTMQLSSQVLRLRPREEAAPARTVLTPTGGYLAGGYTHTFNPAVGCAWASGACGSFCYARGFAERSLGRGAWGTRVVWKENAPERLAAELGRASRRDRGHRHHLSRLRVFSAATTDPLATRTGLELYRECLRVVADRPPARWVLQTRSPRVVELEEELVALGERVVVSFTLETDDEELWRSLPRGAPGIAARRRAFEHMRAWRVRRHLAVSPALPARAPTEFADWISAHATEATVDTFTSGDGSGGARTARSELPARLGIDWRDEAPARELHRLLVARMGDAAGWSAEGFARLAGS